MAHSGFWETMSILVDKDWKTLALEDIQEWLDKILLRRECCIMEDDEVSVIGKRRRLSVTSDYEIRGGRGDQEVRDFVSFNAEPLNWFEI
ncbi:hypothetical protein NQ315_005485 [Exocentrus adspersus]|uniref:PNT domain-containing protein n=1 Tax=Exocentrus adspersus TaxID=1586481 RepID=A0AAV8VT45_9CUCU|nr:hypothetical protein NQ315_005485 [Exocentrus adspersus]